MVFPAPPSETSSACRKPSHVLRGSFDRPPPLRVLRRLRMTDVRPLLFDPRLVVAHGWWDERGVEAAHFRFLEDEEALVEERRQRRLADDHLIQLAVDLGAALGIVRASCFDDLRIDRGVAEVE